MAKAMRNTGLVTILLFLIIAGAVGLGFVGDARADEANRATNVNGAQSLELHRNEDVPRVPSDQDGMFTDVEKKGVEVGEVVGETLSRFDDWERGISCYSTTYRVLSCAPMAEKVYELRQTGMRF